MQYQHIGYRLRGFYRAAESGHRREMHPDAQHRLTLLRFREQHGTAAACDAFRISRRTLYRWRRTLRQAHTHPAALIPRSRAPKRCRRPTWCASCADCATCTQTSVNTPWPCCCSPGAPSAGCLAPVSLPVVVSLPPRRIRCATAPPAPAPGANPGLCAGAANHACPAAGPRPRWH